MTPSARPPGRPPILEPLEARRLMSMTAYWKLNESAGTLADDFTPTSANATLVNGPTWSPTAISGGGLQFDGVDDHARINATIGATPSLSIAFWTRPSSLKHQIPIDKTPLGSSGLGWTIKLRSDGAVWFRVGSNSAFTDIKSAATTYAPNTWLHVAATFTGGSARLYVNGVLRASANSISHAVADTTTELRLGQPAAASTTETFGGTLDDVRLYDHALSQSEVTALATQNTGLTAAVNALPSSTQQLALKKATLNWALADAASSNTAGLTTIANDTYDDIRTLLAAPIGTAQPAPANLFPTIRSYSTNPLATSAVSALASLRTSTTTYTKTPTDLTVTIVNQARDMAWGLTHPQSPYRGDYTLLTPTLRRFQKTFESNLAGTLDGDFATSAHAAEMYLMFRTVYPDLILPSRKIQWEAAIQFNADVIDAADGPRLRAAVPGTSWVNADVRRMTALRFAYEVLGTQSYRDTATSTLQLISHSLMPDGGFMYDGLQNEVYTYHGENILALARYWQITGEQLAKDLVVGSYWYYPLSVEPNGTAEYSSGSAWKHYWNQVSGSEAAYVVADLASSPENLRVARWTTPTPSLFLATFHRPDLTPSASPDNYLTYDRNTLGPRGRFGNFSFVGTASDYANDNRGKSTYVGAMVTDFNGTTNGWRLNAALDAAQSRIRFATGPDDNTLQNDVSFPAKIVYYDTAQDEKNAYTVNSSFAALSTSHRLAKYKGGVQNWKGEQQWLFLPDRMVGLVSAEAINDRSAYSMVGSLRFVAGRGSWGTSRNVLQVDENTFSYGRLTVDVIDQNYGTISTKLEDTWDGTSTVVDKKAARLNFVDAAAAATGESVLLTYPSGTRKYYLVEIRPEPTSGPASVPASSITQLTLPSGLRGIDLTSANARLRMITNTTDSPITYTTTLPWVGGHILHTAGEQYRPDFLNAFQSPDTDARGRNLQPTTPKQSRSRTVTVVIPPQQHIVLEPLFRATTTHPTRDPIKLPQPPAPPTPAPATPAALTSPFSSTPITHTPLHTFLTTHATETTTHTTHRNLLLKTAPQA